MKKRLGDYVTKNEPLCVMYINDDSKADAAEKEFLGAFTISDEKPAPSPMIHEIIGG